MNSFEVYQAWIALKKHFSSWDYDYIKYKGKLKNISLEKFELSKDRWRWEKLSRHWDPVSLMVSQILDDKKWQGDLTGAVAESHLRERMKARTSIMYNFSRELELLGRDPGLFVGQPYPRLVLEFLGGHVSPETAAILVHMAGCAGAWRKASKGDPAFTDAALKIVKYHTFLEYDPERIRKKLKEFFDA